MNLLTHYSIQESFGHIDTLVEQAVKLGFKSLIITDTHTLSGCSEFLKECKKHKIKPILGCTFRLSDTDDDNITLIAKNKNGWKNLIKILGSSTLSENKQEIVSIGNINKYRSDLICMAYPSSLRIQEFQQIFDNILINNGNAVYYATPEDHLLQKIIMCSKEKMTLKEGEAQIQVPLFQRNEFYLKNPAEYPLLETITGMVEDYDIAEKPSIPRLVDNPNEYLTQLCRDGWIKRGLGKLPKNLQNVYAERIKKELGVLNGFNLSNYMLVIWDIANFATKQGILVGLRGSAVGCLTAHLLGISQVDPIIPDPISGYNEHRTLMFERFINKGRFNLGKISFDELSYENFLKIKFDTIDRASINLPIDNNKILNRILFDEEMSIIQNQKDALSYYKYLYDNIDLSNNSANSHIMYACGKTDKLNKNEPVRYSDRHISLCDIDLDCGINGRKQIIDYIHKKYGNENVAHIITFSRLDGHGAIKEAFRVLHGDSQSVNIANTITGQMYSTSKVQDILQDIIEDDPNYSIIDYCIEEIPEVANFAKEYPNEFNIAKRLVHTIRNTGKHAAGIVISNTPICETFPTKIDSKTKEPLVALEMAEAEYCGAVKYDILGVAALEKISKIQEMINNGKRSTAL